MSHAVHLVSYQLNLVQKAQEIFYNAWKAPLKRGRKGFPRMNVMQYFQFV